jgi:hypothetical protein
MLDGQSRAQSVGGPQEYHAKSLKELRRKYAAVSDPPEPKTLFDRIGCLEWLSD